MAAAFGILLVDNRFFGARLGSPLDVLLLGLGVAALARRARCATASRVLLLSLRHRAARSVRLAERSAATDGACARARHQRLAPATIRADLVWRQTRKVQGFSSGRLARDAST